MIHTQGDSSAIHHAQPFVYRLDIRERVVTPGIGIRLGVSIVHAIDFGGFDHHLGIDFHRAQGAGRIGGEIGVACPGPQDHHPPFFQMTDCPAANVGLGDSLHLDGGLHSRDNAHPLQCILQRQCVHHGRQHAHVVSGCALHAMLQALLTTPEVTCADNQSDLNVEIVHPLDLGGQDFGLGGIDTKAIRPGQGFSAQFKQNSSIFDVIHGACNRVSVGIEPS